MYLGICELSNWRPAEGVMLDQCPLHHRQLDCLSMTTTVKHPPPVDVDFWDWLFGRDDSSNSAPCAKMSLVAMATILIINVFVSNI